MSSSALTKGLLKGGFLLKFYTTFKQSLLAAPEKTTHECFL